MIRIAKTGWQSPCPTGLNGAVLDGQASGRQLFRLLACQAAGDGSYQRKDPQESGLGDIQDHVEVDVPEAISLPLSPRWV